MPKKEEQIIESQLKLAYWFTAHKEQLKKIGLLIFIFVDAVLVLTGAWGLLDYYLGEDINFPQLIKINVNKPVPLQIESTMIIDSGFNKYDLVAKVFNQNQDYLVPIIKYRFFVNNEAYTATATSFMLTGQEKYLMALEYDYPERIKDASLILEQVSWQRASKNYKEIEIKITDEKLSPLETASNSNIQSLTFKAENNSLYNIREVGFQILFLGSQNRILSANYLLINNFLNFSQREVGLNIFNFSGRPREIKIIPEVNIIDPTNFFNLEPPPPT